MKFNKSNIFLSIVNEYLIDSPAPKNLNYFWNFGSLLGLNLIIMIISGVTLAMHYTPNIELAFASVEHIMRDVNNGWLIRYIHANGASLFFIWVYLHIGRGLYYGSYKSPRANLWIIGIFIYFIMMATAFLGQKISLKWQNLLRNFNLNLPYAIKIYENLHTIPTQLAIKFENKHKAGIYCIFNKINGKYYIGSAITNRINTRFRNNCIHGSGSIDLKNAINKYGLHNFNFLILEYYPGLILKDNLKKSHQKLIELETEYIAKYKPEYNILNYGEECKNRIYTEEERLQLRNTILKRYSLQPNLKQRLSLALSKPVILYKEDNITIHSEYTGIRQMAKVFKCCHKTINKYIANKKIFKNIGYIKYKTNK